MTTENSEITLEELLQLSINTPEKGAVNFNHLFQVILGILKHLDIEKRKFAEVSKQYLKEKRDGKTSNDGKYPDDGKHDKDTTNSEDAVDAAEASKDVNANKAHDGKGNEEVKDTKGAKNKENSQDTKEGKSINETNEIPSETANGWRLSKVRPEKEAEESFSNASGSKESSKLETSSSKEELADSSKTSPSQRCRESKVSKHAPSLGHRDSSPGKRPPTANLSKQRSNDRGLSGMDTVGGAYDAPHANRRESKLPAGDACHILNINRRLEAAEATIQAMVGLVDNVVADIMDVKEGLKDSSNLYAIGMTSQLEPLPKENMEEIERLKREVKKLKETIREMILKFDVLNSHSIDTAGDKVKECQGVTSNAEMESKKDQKKSSVSTVSSTMLPKIVDLEHSQVHLRQQVQEIRKTMESSTDHEVVSNRIMPSDSNLVSSSKSNTEAVKSKEAGKEVSLMPSDISERLKLIEKRCENYDDLTKELTHLKASLESQAKMTRQQTEKEEALASKVRELEQTMEDVVSSMSRKHRHSIHSQSSASKGHEELLLRVKVEIEKLQEKHEKAFLDIKSVTEALNDQNTKQGSLAEQILNLNSTMVDKETLKELLSRKVERKELQCKVNKDLLTNCIKELDKTIQELAEKVLTTEATNARQLSRIEGEILTKINRQEVESLRSHVENRIRNMKPVIKEQEDKGVIAAAGLRKQVVTNFNCISCAKPVDVPTEGQIPPLPVPGQFPIGKNIRPYLTFDLDQVRHHLQKNQDGTIKRRFEAAEDREKLQKELIKFSRVQGIEELAEKLNRACGGEHTMVDQQKKNCIKAIKTHREEVHVFSNIYTPEMETDVLGRDGQVYRGRMESLPNVISKHEIRPKTQHAKRESLVKQFRARPKSSLPLTSTVPNGKSTLQVAR